MVTGTGTSEESGGHAIAMAVATATIGASGNTPVKVSRKTPYTIYLTVKGTVTGILLYVAGMVKVTETGEVEGVTSSSLTVALGTSIARGVTTPLKTTRPCSPWPSG